MPRWGRQHGPSETLGPWRGGASASVGAGSGVGSVAAPGVGSVAGEAAIAIERPPGRRRYRPGTAVAVASLGAFLAFMDSTVVNVAFPDIRTAFPHSSVGDVSWVLNAYNVVFAGLLVLSGRLADLFGRKRLFLAGLVLFAVTSGLCAAATSVPMLIAFRVAQGAGAALVVPTSLAIVVHASSKEDRAKALGLWAAASALAAGLGPPIGGALVDAYDWRLVFLVNVPLGVLAWLLTRRSVLESRAPGRRRLPDVRGALSLSAGLAALSLAIVQGPTWGWASAGVVTCLVVTVVAAVAAAVSSRHHPAPILDPQLLAIRAFGLSTAITVLLGLGLYTYLLAHILWLHYVWGYSLLLAGACVAPGAAVAAIVARPLGHLADRYGTRVVAVPGALVWAAAYLWYATQVGVHPHFLGEWLPGQVLSGIGVGATLPVVASGGLMTVPALRYATASAVNATARQVGGVLGIAVLTALVAHPAAATLPGDLRHGWELAGGSFAAAALLAVFFGPRAETVEVRPAAPDAVVLPGGTRPEQREVLPAVPPSTDLLAALSRSLRDRLLQAATVVQLRAGEILFSEGDPGDALYLLQAGRLRVLLPDGSARDVTPGTTVGELALLTAAPRSATVVARRDSALLRLSASTFGALADRDPGVLAAIAGTLAGQLQRSRPIGAPGGGAPKVLAVVGVSPTAPAEHVAEQLVAALARTCRVSRLVDPAPAALQRAEADHDLVIVTAGAGGDPDEVGRQADRIVLVSDRTDPGGVVPSTLGPSFPQVPTDVVVAAAAPSEEVVGRWHQRIGCRRVYPIGPAPAGWPAALRPLAARLAGRSVALVLGGGGARGLAHLGVLHALEDAGVVVDRIAGTSSGAIVAAAYALLGSADAADELVFEELVVAEPLGGWRPSRSGLMRGERIARGIERSLGGHRLEALSRELVVVSTDLYRREPVYHRIGPLGEAVAASVAIPVLLPPRRVDGRLLVDGSLADNVPAAAFGELPEGPILAVRTTPPASERVPDRAPGLGEMLFRVLQMSDRDSAAAGSPAPTVSVLADTRGIGFLEFHQIDAAREAGRRAGEAAVEALRDRVGGWVVGR